MTSRETTGLLPRDGSARRRTPVDWAWQLGLGAITWPWLLRSLRGGSRAAKRALLDRLDLPVDALPNLGSWKADTGLLTLIVDHIEAHRPRTVVEFGSGATSLIIARALQLHGGGRLHSYDQHAPFVAATADWLAGHGLDADMRHAPLEKAAPGWPGLWYDAPALPPAIDLLVIDGPPWTIHPLTRGSAESLFPRLATGGTVLLDDAARPGERIVARRWRRRWPDFDFRLTRLAALFHDVGKPKTRSYRRGNGVSFHHHEVVGARMTRERMQALRYSADDTEAVTQLVELHLRFHTYKMGWTDAAVRASPSRNEAEGCGG